METAFSIKKFDHLIAIRAPSGRVVGFNSENLEVASLSEEAWNQGLRIPELRAWNQMPDFLTEEKQVPSHAHKVKAITINVTQVCNLHCTYCAAGGDGSFGDPVKKISVEKTLPQIRFFLDKLNSGDEFRLTFLGGEPLLYPQAIRILSEYSFNLAQEKGVHLKFVVVTNGTQFTPENIELLKDIKADITISIDGPAEINDGLRPNKAGKGVTDAVVSGVQLLLKQKAALGSVGMSGVFGAKNMSLEAAYGFYREFAIDWFDFTYDHLETSESINAQFTNSLLKIAKMAFETGGERELRRIKIFDQYFQALDSQVKNVNFCGAGKSFLMIDARNQIYTCPWVVGDKTEIVGLGPELFSERLEAYGADLVDQNNCHSCWAKFVCGGGCMFIHKNKTGDKHQVDTNFCNRTRDLIAASLLYYEESRGLTNQVQEKRAPSVLHEAHLSLELI